MKLPLEISLDIESIPRSIRLLPRPHAHDMLEAMMAGMDTDSIIYMAEWIAVNRPDPERVSDCPRCRRLSFRISGHFDPMVKVCEYCGAVLP